MVNNKLKLLFIPIPKTGTESVIHTLHLKSVNPSKKKNMPYKHTSINDILNEKNKLNHLIQTYFIFSFIRHPYDRFLSCYHYFTEKRDKINKYKFKSICDMVKFIKNDEKALRIWNPMTTWINPKYIHLFNFIGRYENLEKDFKKLKKLTNIKDKIKSPIIRYNVSKKRNIKSRQYPYIRNKYVRDFCYEYYKKDFETFNYKP